MINGGRGAAIGTNGTATLTIDLVYDVLKATIDRTLLLQASVPESTAPTLSPPFRTMYYFVPCSFTCCVPAPAVIVTICMLRILDMQTCEACGADATAGEMVT